MAAVATDDPRESDRTMPSRQSMSQELWNRVDEYLTGVFVGDDPGADALRASAAAGLPAIHVSPNQAQFLSILARSIGARRILEIGTLGGYSSIWLARALPPDGLLISLELDPRHAEIARSNVDRAGLRDKVEIRQGPALKLLSQLAAESTDRFDFVFVDADKPNASAYFDWASEHTRSGGLIVVDNVVREGEIIDVQTEDPDVRGMQQCLRQLSADRRVTAVGLQTVGVKGYDGFVLAIVNDPTHA